MASSSELRSVADSQTKARESVSVAPIPDWADHTPVQIVPPAKAGHNFTGLLFERQIEVGKRQTCFRQAVRLETMEAVQSQSQWRLSFEPRTQAVFLHWIKIVRGDTETEHLKLESARLLERETGLEGLVIDGSFTLLLVLEDVRPGDVLDWCYTVEDRSELFAAHCASWFALPVGIVVAQYRFAVRFEESRSLQWKSSNPDLAPTERRECGMVFWEWLGQILEPPMPEPCTPEWHLGFQWMQISDFPDWALVAAILADAWKEDADDHSLDELAREIEQSDAESVARVERALRLVQDEHRYLSVNLELGGQIPTPPASVARRRYGDCKDLCFLLVHILRRLGVAARPVLVHTVLRKSIADLLPMPGLFNHVVVEFQLNGETRWVDATLKQQGGGPLRRVISEFGFGLPVDSPTTALLAQPAALPNLGTYELTEHILLETSGGPSLIAVSVHAQGSHAEALRRQFETTPRSELADERQRAYAKQFSTATRTGDLQHRYDRDANEFVISEVFAIKGFLGRSRTPDTCHFQIPTPLIAQVLAMADATPRRTPFGLPHPCFFTHTVVVESSSLSPMTVPRYDLKTAFLRCARRVRSLHRTWSMTLSFSTETDSVAPEQISGYRSALEEIWRESNWSLTIPVGIPRPLPSRNFGVLPTIPKIVSDEGISSRTPVFSPSGAIPDYPTESSRTSKNASGKNPNVERSKGTSAGLRTGLAVAGIVIAAILIVIIALSRL